MIPLGNVLFYWKICTPFNLSWNSGLPRINWIQLAGGRNRPKGKTSVKNYFGGMHRDWHSSLQLLFSSPYPWRFSAYRFLRRGEKDTTRVLLLWRGTVAKWAFHCAPSVHHLWRTMHQTMVLLLQLSHDGPITKLSTPPRGMSLTIPCLTNYRGLHWLYVNRLFV